MLLLDSALKFWISRRHFNTGRKLYPLHAAIRPFPDTFLTSIKIHPHSSAGSILARKYKMIIPNEFTHSAHECQSHSIAMQWTLPFLLCFAYTKNTHWQDATLCWWTYHAKSSIGQIYWQKIGKCTIEAHRQASNPWIQCCRSKIKYP